MNRGEIILLKALGGMMLRIKENILLMLVVGIVAWALLFFSPRLFAVSKGYINNFFLKKITPEIQKDGGRDKTNIDDENLDKNAEDDSVESLSERFVRFCFARDEKNIKALLADNTFYIKSSDGSSFIRCINGEEHIEGYMATDKSLFEFRERWHYVEEDAAISGMEIILEGRDKALIWYLYFKKQNGLWKLYMLENE